MISVINMQDMRHLNLFRKVTRIETRYCFKYNEIIMFGVPRHKVSQALGRDGENLKRLSDVLKKRVRIIPLPEGEKDIKKFIEAVIAPVSFNEIQITNDEVVVNAGSQNKAALLGRNKRRLLEMQNIIKDFFKKEYRVI